MSDISKAYTPTDVENKWYEKWLSSGCFNGKPDVSKEAYSIVIPPPNVTGVLTMGHVLNNTIQDILIRRARQSGKSAIWIPGTDHAGVATQTKVEKVLRSEGTSARQLGREKFIERAKDWRDTHGGIIIEQLKKLGTSCDWSRLTHTLDDDYSEAVLTAFVKLYEKGYIYRGKRMVNWCPVNLTALSDEEVIPRHENGKFFKMKYKVVEEPNTYLEICTTRPETIMGDSAVAVNPDDPRYRHLIGKHCLRPFPEAEIPIIADKYVDMEFGTGALKITPAHDPADFEIGQRHNLPIIDIMNPDATMNALAGKDFEGLDRDAARKLAVKKLDELGLLIEIQDYEHNVGYSERGNVPIEPRLSDQWFLKYPKIQEAKQVVESGLIKFWPKRWEKTYTHWLDNIRDWCISRQIWWGHRIPVWYKKGVKNIDFKNPEHVHVSVKGPSDPENWTQDEDSLDTWASSWLWPFATMGWPNKDAQAKKALDYFYPTSDLVTGPDIIFFWVARMIMAGLEFMDGTSNAQKIPFKNVYFTGIIRDMQGRKMSKSLGNSPDPLEIIAKYGADGLRFGIMNCAAQGQDILFSEERVELGRNFCNKLWNACRFRQMQGASDNSTLEKIVARIDKTKLDSDDIAVLSSLIQTSKAISIDYQNYQFNSITQRLYAFFWTDFCDWYLEVSKSRMAENGAKATILAVQDICLRGILLMSHPFIPFISEELWHSMGFGTEDSFLQNENPFVDKQLEKLGILIDSAALKNTENMREFVSKARALKAQYKLANKRDVKIYATAKAEEAKLISENSDKLKRLIGAAIVEVKEQVKDCPAMLCELGTVYLDLSDSIDVEAEKKRLTKEKEKLEGAIKSTLARLSNEAFTSKAPQKVIDGAKKQLEENQKKLAEIEKLLSL